MSMSLLFVLTDLTVGGAQLMNLRLLRALARRGWRVQAAVLWEIPSAPPVDKTLYANLPLHRLATRGPCGKAILPWRLARLARDADIVVGGVAFAATNYGYIAARLADRPFLSWTHTAFAHHQYAAGPLDRRISRWVYRRCRNVVFPSHGSLRSLRQALGGQPRGARWLVIENFLDFMPVKTSYPPDRLIYSKPVLLGVGRLAKNKAFDRLIRAHATLRAQGIDHNLLILGDGPERGRLQRLIQELGVGMSAFLKGYVEDIWEWLCQAQVFAVCSRYEGFSLVLLEALAAGLPCVAMDCESGPREVLQDGTYGLLTPADDEAAFQAALARIFRDQFLRADLAARARIRAEYYSEERILPQWEELFRRLAEERN